MSKIDFNEMKVEVQLKNKGFTRALFGIEYFGLRITHLRLLANKKDGTLFVSMPMLYNKMKVLWVPDKEDRIKFEKLLMDEYLAYKEKIKNKEAMTNIPLDELDPDEIM